MVRIGFWLCVFGALSLLLPRFGYDLYLIDRLGERRLVVSVAMIVVGAALILYGWKRRTAGGKKSS